MKPVRSVMSYLLRTGTFAAHISSTHRYSTGDTGTNPIWNDRESRRQTQMHKYSNTWATLSAKRSILIMFMRL